MVSSDLAGGPSPGGDGGATPEVIAALAEVTLGSTLFLFAVADRLDMAVTDLCCLLLVRLEGPGSAGWLAERSGLSTGAITGVVDRLARAGWVRREADGDDRRRVLVAMVTERVAGVDALLTPLGAGLVGAAGSFSGGSGFLGGSGSSGVLAGSGGAVGVLRAATAALAAGVRQLRRGEADGAGRAGDRRPPPLLRLESWTGDLAVRGGTPPFPPGEPVRLGPGSRLVLRARGGRCTVSSRGGRHRQGRDEEVVEVDGSTPWLVEMAGGANRMHLDLTDITLAGLTIGGGANSLRVALPAPKGVVPVRLTGGANDVRIERPAGSAVTLIRTRRSSDVRLDGERVDADIGIVAADRYEVEVTGAASRLVISAFPPAV